MLSRLYNFSRRHRNKFLVVGAVAGGVALLGRYAEARVRQWREEETRAMLEAARRGHHFENTQRTGSVTLQSLLGEVGKAADRCLDTEAAAEEIRSNPEDKVALWEELKVTAAARCVARILCSVHLTALLRLELNVLGGRLYHDTTTTSAASTLTTKVQEKYLELCQAFISQGAGDLCLHVLESARVALSSVGLKRKVSILELEELFQAIIKSVRREKETVVNEFLLRPDRLDCSSLSDAESEVLDGLFQDTRDILELSDFQSAVDKSVQHSLSLLFDALAEELHASASSKTAAVGKNSFSGPTEICLPFARVIPILNSASDSCSEAVSRELLRSEVIAVLSSNVYEAFCSSPPRPPQAKAPSVPKGKNVCNRETVSNGAIARN